MAENEKGRPVPTGGHQSHGPGKVADSENRPESHSLTSGHSDASTEFITDIATVQPIDWDELLGQFSGMNFQDDPEPRICAWHECDNESDSRSLYCELHTCMIKGCGGFARYDDMCNRHEQARRAYLAGQQNGRLSSNGAKRVNGADKGRHLRVTWAHDIEMKPVRWLWSGETDHEGRIPQGMLVLIAGREGTGKSSVMYTVAAQVTNGTLPGIHYGTPKAVFVAAYEDSWQHTIKPRLAAAGADMSRVGRVEVQAAGGPMSMSLPNDNRALEDAINAHDAAMVILDPLMSSLDAQMKSKDYQSVYQALLPIAGIADRTGCAFVGITHFNKSTGTDPMARIMGSAAFAGVVRGALIVHKVKPDETIVVKGADPFALPDEMYLLGHEKNNVGRKLPTLVYSISEKLVGSTAEGDVYAPRVIWHGETDETVASRMESEETPNRRETKTSVAREWLWGHMSDGEWHEKPDVLAAAKEAGHAQRTIERAANELIETGKAKKYHVPPRAAMWTTNLSVPDPS